MGLRARESETGDYKHGLGGPCYIPVFITPQEFTASLGQENATLELARRARISRSPVSKAYGPKKNAGRIVATGTSFLKTLNDAAYFACSCMAL